MKVILTAFNGKLKSDVMDWPEEMKGQDIHLVMDMERPSVKQDEQSRNIYEIAPCRGRFEFTNSYGIGKDLPAIYRLVKLL